MKTINALVFDLDGSLLNHYKDVSPANLDILHQLGNKGCILGIASGRAMDDVLRLLERCRIRNLISFVIASNGCSYLNLKTGRRIESGYLDSSVFSWVQKKIRKYSASCALMENNRLVTDRTSMAGWLYGLTVRKIPVRVENISVSKPFPKMYVLGFPAQLKRIRKLLKKESFQIIPSGRYSLEIVARGTSKANCLQHVLEDFSLQPENILSFGDDYNDLELIRSTCGAAMKNAVPALQKAAESITKYNASQDGVAYHLNQMILGGNYVFENPNSEA